MAHGRQNRESLLIAAVGAALIFTAGWLAESLPWAPLLLGVSFTASMVVLGSTHRGQESDDPPGLQQSEHIMLQRLRAVVEALPQPVMLLDSGRRIDTFNPACAALFGEEVNRRHIAAVVRAPQALEVIRTVEQTGEPFEAEFAWTGAQPRTCLFYAAPLSRDDIGGEAGMFIMIRDRTEQRKLERMRTDFIANASHELRTPLTSMSGFIETLQNHARNDPAAQERFLRIMAEQTERMLRLVEDLVNLSAIELNEAKPPADRVDVVAIAGSVVESLQPVAERGGGILRFESAPDHAMITGDRLELFRLLQNLCDNALKYGVTPRDGKSRVSVLVGTGRPPQRAEAVRTGESPAQVAVRMGVDETELVYVQIRDEGAGIERTDLPRLTERFYRVNPQLSKNKGGTGLGLAIVKHILQRHRGGLQIESIGGEGAWFSVMLPPRLGNDIPTSNRSSRSSNDASDKVAS